MAVRGMSGLTPERTRQATRSVRNELAAVMLKRCSQGTGLIFTLEFRVFEVQRTKRTKRTKIKLFVLFGMFGAWPCAKGYGVSWYVIERGENKCSKN